MITTYQLRQLFIARNAYPITTFFMDSHYAEPTQASMEIFWNSFSRNLRTLGLSQFRDEVWDCDKWSRVAWAFMSISYARTFFKANEKMPECGIAFGVFNYLKDALKPHSINFASIDLKLRFYEPQLSQEIQLTTPEITSCLGIVV